MISSKEAWRQPGTGAWLGEAEESLLPETKALHTHKACVTGLCLFVEIKNRCQQTDISNLKKKRFEEIELSAKLLDYFLVNSYEARKATSIKP